jgi:hypothetical protein
MTATAAAPVYKSRWNLYYPCDYETYRMLRRIRGAFENARKRAASWNRWHAKAPHNRKVPEPELIMPFTRIDRYKLLVRKSVKPATGRISKYEFMPEDKQRAKVDWHVMCDARLMARGHRKPEDVVPLLVTKEEVVALCQELGLPTAAKPL